MIKINGIDMGSDCFPNNERILETSELEDRLGLTYSDTKIIFDFQYQTDIDISMLVMLKKYIDDTYPYCTKILRMKYIPYSRMDRKIKGYVFTLKYFCQLINDLKFDGVEVLDPHSNVASGLLDRCYEIDISGFVGSVFAKLDYKVDYVFYPDNGACKRYSEILNLRTPYFFGNKKRNLQTGEIVSYELIDCPDIKDKNILIIDDLCAKGFTFYNAAQKLKEQGASAVYLYVSHCENSIYNGKLIKSKIISKIFTTDSILTDWSSSLIERVG